MCWHGGIVFLHYGIRNTLRLCLELFIGNVGSKLLKFLCYHQTFDGVIEGSLVSLKVHCVTECSLVPLKLHNVTEASLE